VKCVVAIEYIRCPPSSCELSMRNCSGHIGHGVKGERSAGGIGMISN
jgi:hypothetical protein